jgi:hypothetical protein
MSGNDRHFRLSERNAKIEKIKANQAEKASALKVPELPTVPISLESAGPDEDGVFIRHLFSASGEVSGGIVQIDSLSNGPVALLIETIIGDTTDYVGVAVKEGLNHLHIPPIKVLAGTLLTMKILGHKEVGVIRVGFNWRGNV